MKKADIRSAYSLYINSDAAKQHLPYDAERAWMESIENGSLSSDFALNATLPPNVFTDFLGTLAPGNDFKQLEYITVSTVTISARAAIRGGVSPHNAYSLSDVWLQKLSVCRTIEEISYIQANAPYSFARQVRLAQNAKKENPYIEQCKDFVGRNLRSKFTIRELAKELGISSAYLSRLFSGHMHMTLQQYVLEQRLKAAANMLKYAPNSISDISDYLCFSSPSYFGKCFCERYHMTPSEYRKIHRAIGYS